ncbi:hypothetical protein E2986_09387 [Frieseomelitta varia]|uniref:Uncharacterized protein n=1 Tax=Frieseomelitta varia TaxID=561572 RepID=A0A833W4W4_9HYME|nr:hypothetical protein E2986_09387 [Frieseomelitta varia]
MLNERDIPGSQGRRGLGNIYVWASGDGGEEDDCNCDGYAASMWTVSINSAINDGQNAHYDESCSSTLASTFSNGAKDPNIGVRRIETKCKELRAVSAECTRDVTQLPKYSEHGKENSSFAEQACQDRDQLEMIIFKYLFITF